MRKLLMRKLPDAECLFYFLRLDSVTVLASKDKTTIFFVDLEIEGKSVPVCNYGIP